MNSGAEAYATLPAATTETASTVRRTAERMAQRSTAHRLEAHAGDPDASELEKGSPAAVTHTNGAVNYWAGSFVSIVQ